MNENDPVLSRLSELGAPPVDAALSARIKDAARVKLVPRRLGLLWQVVISAAVVSYLGWALVFSSRLLEH
jgi:hypothetical protein